MESKAQVNTAPEVVTQSRLLEQSTKGCGTYTTDFDFSISGCWKFKTKVLADLMLRPDESCFLVCEWTLSCGAQGSLSSFSILIYDLIERQRDIEKVRHHPPAKSSPNAQNSRCWGALELGGWNPISVSTCLAGIPILESSATTSWGLH